MAPRGYGLPVLSPASWAWMQLDTINEATNEDIDTDGNDKAEDEEQLRELFRTRSPLAQLTGARAGHVNDFLVNDNRIECHHCGQHLASNLPVTGPPRVSGPKGIANYAVCE